MTAGFSGDTFSVCVDLLVKCVALRGGGHLVEALALLDAFSPTPVVFPPLVTERARILCELGRVEACLAECKRLLFLSNTPENHLFREQMAAQALVFLDQENSVVTWDVLLLRKATVFLLAEDFPRAVVACQEILAVEPQHRDALINLGSALVSLQRYDEALGCYQRALALDAGDATVWYNRGNVLRYLHRIDEAVDAYRQALQCTPGFPEAQLEIAFCQLMSGCFDAGWKQLEWRWQTRQLRSAMPGRLALPWRGEQDVSGRRVLLWAEQGLGDTIQFARFAPRVADLGAQVVLRVPESLVVLMQSLDVRVKVVGDSQPIPAHDVQCPLMSLPLVLGVAAPAGEAALPYLFPSADKCLAWSERLSALRRPRIGIAWAGRQSGRLNLVRDVPLASLAPLWGADVSFVCLQRDVPEREREAKMSIANLFDCSQEFTSLDDTAALIQQLDLVISADSMIAHLAGALGRPCWVMLSFAGEWRWMLDRKESDWYPAMRLVRQPRPGDWDFVVAEICGALSQFCESLKTPPLDP